MQLRPYQIEAIDATFEAWGRAQSLLGVAATGLGKTVLFASILARHPGRTMVIAHREELIFQAADKVKRVTGLEPDIEMAELRSPEWSLHGKPRCVISTVQTQVAGRNGGRMTRFDPAEFDLLVIDEAHHATASTYRQVIDHYRQNPNLRVLGVTATPDRADEEALGQIFDDVAFDYDLRYGIEDGWLVPVGQRVVHVESLDLSAVRTTAGDLNGADLARVLEMERPLHEIVGPTIELTADGRRTLVFTASVAQAERTCEIFNRHRGGCARWVCGKTPKDERRQMLADYSAGQFQYLVNVGVATEGFDEPGIASIVMARPTKSRALYCQMVGRGTRPLPGVVDDPDLFGTASGRRQAIANSQKRQVEIIDFVGNSGRHRLITTADILGGNYSDEVVDRARATAEKTGSAPDVMTSLDQAARELQEERERARRSRVVARASFKSSYVDPFDAFGLEPWRERGWDKSKQPSEKQLALLERQGIKSEGLTYTQVRQLVAEITSRFGSNRCSYKQARILAAHNLATDVTREEASRLIDEIAAREGWKSSAKSHRPSPTQGGHADGKQVTVY